MAGRKPRSQSVVCTCKTCEGRKPPIPRTTATRHSQFDRLSSAFSNEHTITEKLTERFGASTRRFGDLTAAALMLDGGIAAAGENASIDHEPEPELSDTPEGIEEPETKKFDEGCKGILSAMKDILRAEKSYLSSSNLAFLHPPLPQSNPDDPHRLELNPTHASNQAIIRQRLDLDSIQQTLDRADCGTFPSLLHGDKVARQSLVGLREKIDLWVRNDWEAQRNRAINASQMETRRSVVYTDIYFEHTFGFTHIVHLACWTLAVALHLLFGVSHEDTSRIVQCIQLILNIALSVHPTYGSPFINPPTLEPMQFSSKSILSRFDLFTPLNDYVHCVKCHHGYRPEQGSFPETCTNVVDGEPCGEPLGRLERRSGGKTVRVPRMRFEYYSVKDWIGRMLSRPEVEKAMDDAEIKAGAWNGVKDTLADIWDGRIFRSFKWKSGMPFWTFPRLGAEGRLAFSFNIDWFNAHHSGTGKKKASIGAMYLVCFNLPASIRYRPENICLVGLIPGPKKPSARFLNNYLKPMIDDFVDLWDKGVWYTRTALRKAGRLMRAVLIPVVCDLDAVRAVVGFSSHTSTLFCSYCYLTAPEITNFDASTWEWRTSEQHRQDAMAWKNASSPEARAELEAKHGATYSEFLRLEYFRPTDFTVIDIMHNMFLGNFKRHCRSVWGMDIDVEGGDGSIVTLSSVPSKEKLDAARVLLRSAPAIKSLEKLYVDVLEALCIECGVTRSLKGFRTKLVMLQTLQTWRKENGFGDPHDPLYERPKSRRSHTSPEISTTLRPSARGVALTEPISAVHRLPTNPPALTALGPITPTPPANVPQTMPVHIPSAVPATILPAASPSIPLTMTTPIPTPVTPAPEEHLLSRHYVHRWPESLKKADLQNIWRMRRSDTDPPVEPATKHQLAVYIFTKHPELGVKFSKPLQPLSHFPIYTTPPYPPASLAPNIDTNTSAQAHPILLSSTLHSVGDPPLNGTASQIPAPTMNGNEGAQPRPPRIAGLPLNKDNTKAVKSARTVLGSKLLGEVRHDIDRTVLPDWLKRAPREMGSKGHGKLSANEWRVACTIHFVITLVRLWGAEPHSSRNHQMLFNFLHLVAAASLCARRTTSAGRAEQVHSHMLQYLKSLQDLFPQVAITPNLHLSLHLREFLLAFGPPHSWWAFPFERFNGILQRIAVNHRFTLLERSIMRTFCQVSRFKAILQDRLLPASLHGLAEMLTSKIKSSYKGTLEVDNIGKHDEIWTATPYNPDHKALHRLNNQEAALAEQHQPEGLAEFHCCAKIQYRGATFSPMLDQDRNRPAGGRNSSILYKVDGFRRFGRIVKILDFGPTGVEHPLTDSLVFIEQYRELSDADSCHDPYRGLEAEFSGLECRLVYKQFGDAPKIDVIRHTDIVAHVARCPFKEDQPRLSEECLVLLSLERS